ncbi:MAG: bifunctional nuclease family protein [Bacteroidales bacterium]|nr:bifunctional nuclease family protein [Bacteroidales bacterium]MCQ2270012.1 bifunctional nuclease family protein [Bacteroidales bacterium]
MVELEVSDIRNAQSPSEAFALVLTERQGDRVLPIVIGMNEARAIVLEMSKMKPKRPTSHDLFLQLSDACNIVAENVEIHKFEEGIFYANINMRRENGELLVIDSRTSDAVVLALKWHIPIYIHEDILDNYLSDNIDEVKNLMENEEPEEDDINLSDENYDKYISAKLEEMSMEELEHLLEGAVECEDFEMASKIHEEIEKRKA